jgi:hypothetical protein
LSSPSVSGTAAISTAMRTDGGYGIASATSAAAPAAPMARPERRASAEPSTTVARSGRCASSRTTIVVSPASASTENSETNERASEKRP